MKRRFTFDDSAKELEARGWPRKSSLEARQFVVSIRPWLDHLSSKYGEITEMLHLDNPDDPPDVYVTFENSTIGFEVTQLLPEEFAHFEQVISDFRKDHFTVSPTLSAGKLTRGEMVRMGLDLDGMRGLAAVGEETRLLKARFESQFRKKTDIAGKQGFQFLVMYADSHHLSSTYSLPIACHLNEIIQNEGGPFPSVIIFVDSNPTTYETFLLIKGQQARRRLCLQRY
jgi:hypothetical protein